MSFGGQLISENKTFQAIYCTLIRRYRYIAIKEIFEIKSQKFVHGSFEALVVSKRKHLLLLLSLSFLFFHFNKSLLIFGESFKTSTFAIYMTFKPFVLAKLSTA